MTSVISGYRPTETTRGQDMGFKNMITNKLGQETFDQWIQSVVSTPVSDPFHSSQTPKEIVEDTSKLSRLNFDKKKASPRIAFDIPIIAPPVINQEKPSVNVVIQHALSSSQEEVDEFSLNEEQQDDWIPPSPDSVFAPHQPFLFYKDLEKQRDLFLSNSPSLSFVKEDMIPEKDLSAEHLIPVVSQQEISIQKKTLEHPFLGHTLTDIPCEDRKTLEQALTEIFSTKNHETSLKGVYENPPIPMNRLSQNEGWFFFPKGEVIPFPGTTHKVSEIASISNASLLNYEKNIPFKTTFVKSASAEQEKKSLQIIVDTITPHLVQQRQGVLRIPVRHERFGVIDIRLHLGGKNVRATLNTSSRDLYDLLNTNRKEIESIFEQADYKIDALQFDYVPDSRRS